MSTDLLMDFARREFERNLKPGFSEPKLSRMRVLRQVSADIDGDGQPETIMVAGIPSQWSPATCALLDDVAGPTVVIPYEEGFSDLRVRAVDDRGRRQVILLWRMGSGAMLTTHVVEWDGTNLHFLLDAPAMNQGLFELKDLDGDGHDELLLWEALADEGANWSPHFYRIHVYALAGQRYSERQVLTTEHRYHPSSIVSQQIGMVGLPVNPSDRGVSLEQRQAELDDHLASGTIDAKLVEDLVGEADRLLFERFAEDAVSLYDLALRGLDALTAEQPRESLRLKAYWDRGVALSMVGRASDAAGSYRKAVELFSGNAWPEPKALSEPVLWREYGAICGQAGQYGEALAAFAAARGALARVTASAVEIKDEASRLESNLAITYFALGDLVTARRHYQLATDIDRELQRRSGLLINLTGLGNVERAASRPAEAIVAYQSALETIGDVSDRDREADVHLELGMTLIIVGRLNEALDHLYHALLLTSDDNLKQQGAKHYLYLGEALLELGALPSASRFFQQVLSMTEDADTVDTRWQALLGLGLIANTANDGAQAERQLKAAIEAVERARPRGMPDVVLSTYLARGRARPYEELVKLKAASPATAKEAFNTAEQSRSRALLERLASTRIAPAAGVSASLLTREAQLVDRIQDLEAQLERGAPAHPQSLSRSLAAERHELDDLLGTVAATGPKGAEYASLRRGRPGRFEELRALLA